MEWVRRWKAFTSLVWPRIQARHNRRKTRNLSSVLACKTFLAERYIVDRNCYNYTSLDEMAEERRRHNLRMRAGSIPFAARRLETEMLNTK